MTKMTAAHVTILERAHKLVRREWGRSNNWQDQADWAAVSEGLNEIAAHIAAQIERNDDAG
jgi:hypothetical protein